MRREMEGIGIVDGSESRIVRFLANTAKWDWHGSQVLPTGASLAAFWKNPVFCWSHPQGTNKVPDPEDVIGRVVAVELTQDSLVIQVEFAPAALNPRGRGGDPSSSTVFSPRKKRSPASSPGVCDLCFFVNLCSRYKVE